jgi:hypothetical protein
MRKNVVGKYNSMYRNKTRRVSFLPSVQEVFGVEGNLSSQFSPESSAGGSTVVSATSDDEEITKEEDSSRRRSNRPPAVEISIGSGFDIQEEHLEHARKDDDNDDDDSEIPKAQEIKISRRPSRRNSRQGVLTIQQMTEIARNAPSENRDGLLGLRAPFRSGEKSMESSVSNSSFQSFGSNLAGSTLPRISSHNNECDISGGSSATGSGSSPTHKAVNSLLREVLRRLAKIENKIASSTK